MSEKKRGRLRALDIHKPIPIIFPEDAADIPTDEAEVLLKPSGSEPKGDIPIPGVTVLDSYIEESESVAGFNRPADYITFKAVADEIDRFVEYELDDEDEQFLADLGNPAMDETVLELALDFLEKESFKQKEYRQVKLNSTLGSEDDEDIPCCVCMERDYSDDNLIVFCDGCDLAIHQDCQGLEEIPDGVWLCTKCLYLKEWDEKHPSSRNQHQQEDANGRTGDGELNDSFDDPKSTQAEITGFFGDKTGASKKRKPKKKETEDSSKPVVSCMMCGGMDGAFKRTTKGNKWIHIVCALYTPELFLQKDMVNVNHLESGRKNLHCVVCNATGGCVQCSVTKCFLAYHVTCAQKNGQLVRVKVSKKNTSDIRYETFCPNHSVVKRNEEIVKAKREKEIPVEIGRFIDQYTKKDMQRKVGTKIARDTFNQIVEYWKQKRYKRKNGRAPFIYRIQVAVEEEDAEFDAGRRFARVTRRNDPIIKSDDMDKYRMMWRMRQDMERLRTLLQLVQNRESRKLKHIRSTKTIFEMLCRGKDSYPSSSESDNEDAQSFDMSQSQSQPLPETSLPMHSDQAAIEYARQDVIMTEEGEEDVHMHEEMGGEFVEPRSPDSSEDIILLDEYVDIDHSQNDPLHPVTHNRPTPSPKRTRGARTASPEPLEEPDYHTVGEIIEPVAPLIAPVDSMRRKPRARERRASPTVESAATLSPPRAGSAPRRKSRKMDESTAVDITITHSYTNGSTVIPNGKTAEVSQSDNTVHSVPSTSPSKRITESAPQTGPRKRPTPPISAKQTYSKPGISKTSQTKLTSFFNK